MRWNYQAVSAHETPGLRPVAESKGGIRAPAASQSSTCLLYLPEDRYRQQWLLKLLVSKIAASYICLLVKHHSQPPIVIRREVKVAYVESNHEEQIHGKR